MNDNFELGFEKTAGNFLKNLAGSAKKWVNAPSRLEATGNKVIAHTKRRIAKAQASQKTISTSLSGASKSEKKKLRKQLTEKVRAAHKPSDIRGPAMLERAKEIRNHRAIGAGVAGVGAMGAAGAYGLSNRDKKQ